MEEQKPDAEAATTGEVVEELKRIAASIQTAALVLEREGRQRKQKVQKVKTAVEDLG